MLETPQIRQFYLRGFKETAKLDEWPGIWRKQFKIRTREGQFLKLNKLRSRLNYMNLLDFCVRYTPLNLYMSALNWLMPERVGRKGRANGAFPVARASDPQARDREKVRSTDNTGQHYASL